MIDQCNSTIVAPATPSGRGGVAIIRISGPNTKNISKIILKKDLTPRYAQYSYFYDENGEILDQGLALFFPAPNSFTGEDVLELHGHGGTIIVDCLLKRILNLGARMARPGEFSERAFLNNKIDLTQAEAIADLIDASSEQAARSAIHSLQGEFSKKIQQLVNALIQLRMYVEAAIDFPEEEIDFLSDGKIENELNKIKNDLENIQESAKQGALLREGMTVAIAGKPNAGKSSLLNALSGKDIAIVTEIAGTTRDVLREKIVIDGMPLNIIDTAGLRESNDPVEREGIRRAINEINSADDVLLIVDSSDHSTLIDFKELLMQLNLTLINPQKITLINNKIDLMDRKASIQKQNQWNIISLSAKTGEGLNLLKTYLKEKMGFQTATESNFIARRRHLDALERAKENLLKGSQQLKIRAGELLAEELRQAQQHLSEITGEFRSNDLLGKIFSSFCIGK